MDARLQSLVTWTQAIYLLHLLADNYTSNATIKGLVDSREVYRRLDPDVRQRWERLGVMYVRNYDGLGGYDSRYASSEGAYVLGALEMLSRNLVVDPATQRAVEDPDRAHEARFLRCQHALLRHRTANRQLPRDRSRRVPQARRPCPTPPRYCQKR